MVSRRRTATASVKPALNAGLTLYAGDGIDSDWVRLVLAEKEVEGARVKLIAPGRIDEDLALLNPAHSLPTLVDREGVLSNAAIIAEYLDERYPHPRLMPAAPAERARIRLALLHLCGDLFPLVQRPGQPLPAGLQSVFRNSLEPTAQQLGNRRWFMGFDFNLADCAWAVMLRRTRATDLRAWPATSAYAQRLFTRPAFVRCFGAANGGAS